MTESICPIWGTPAEKYPVQGYNLHFDSARAGGQFKNSRSALAEDRFVNMDFAAKARLTTWIVNQHRSGTPVPMITTEVVSEACAARSLSFSDKKERLFEYFRLRNLKIGQKIIIRPPFTFPDTDEIWKTRNKISSWIESEQDDETISFFELMSDLNYLTINNDIFEISLKPLGWDKLDQITDLDSKQVFVAMWFDETMNEIYDQGFEPGIQTNTGLTAHRIDKGHFTGKIDDEIIAEIRRSKFVVADFTCGETVRGGVYYEAGFAQGLGKQVIFTCHADQIQQVHFDTRQFNHILWQTPADLQKQLNDRIKALGLAIA